VIVRIIRALALAVSGTLVLTGSAITVLTLHAARTLLRRPPFKAAVAVVVIADVVMGGVSAFFGPLRRTLVGTWGHALSIGVAGLPRRTGAAQSAATVVTAFPVFAVGRTTCAVVTHFILATANCAAGIVTTDAGMALTEGIGGTGSARSTTSIIPAFLAKAIGDAFAMPLSVTGLGRRAVTARSAAAIVTAFPARTIGDAVFHALSGLGIADVIRRTIATRTATTIRPAFFVGAIRLTFALPIDAFVALGTIRIGIASGDAIAILTDLPRNALTLLTPFEAPIAIGIGTGAKMLRVYALPLAPARTLTAGIITRCEIPPPAILTANSRLLAALTAWLFVHLTRSAGTVGGRCAILPLTIDARLLSFATCSLTLAFQPIVDDAIAIIIEPITYFRRRRTPLFTSSIFLPGISVSPARICTTGTKRALNSRIYSAPPATPLAPIPHLTETIDAFESRFAFVIAGALYEAAVFAHAIQANLPFVTIRGGITGLLGRGLHLVASPGT